MRVGWGVGLPTFSLRGNRIKNEKGVEGMSKATTGWRDGYFLLPQPFVLSKPRRRLSKSLSSMLKAARKSINAGKEGIKAHDTTVSLKIG
jgi:hypothetical protein